MIEAGIGYGKTTLLQHVAASWDGPISRSWEPNLDPSTLLIIDDIGQLSTSAAQELADQLGDGSKATWVVAGRWIPPVLRSLADSQLDSAALCMNEEDIAQLAVQAGLDPEAARVVTDFSHGWPTAAAWAVEQLVRHGNQPEIRTRLARQTADQRWLIEDLLAALGPQQDLARVLARLPRFDEQMVELLGHDPTHLAEISSAGLTLHRDAGWIEMPAELRRILLQQPSPPPAVGVYEVGTRFAERAEILAGVDACMAFGDNDAAARVLADRTYRQRMTVSVRDLRRRMATLGPALDAHPRSLLFCAWVESENLGFAAVQDILRRAERAVGDATDKPELHAEILTQHAFELYLASDGEGSSELLRRADTLFPNPTGDAAAVRMEVRSGVHRLAASDSGLEEAARLLAEAAVHWRAVSDTARASSAMMRLALHIHEQANRFTDAVSVLEEALILPGLSASDHARITVLLSRLLPLVNRHEDAAACAESGVRSAKVLDSGWLASMAWWAKARLSSYAGELEQTRLAIEEAEKAMEDMIDHPTGRLFRAEAADALARCGDLTGAQNLLDALGPRESGEEHYAAASVEARLGDPERATELIQLTRNAEDHAVAEWRILFLEALVDFRNHDEVSGHRRLGQANIQLGELHSATALTATESGWLDPNNLAVNAHDEDTSTESEPAAPIAAEISIFGQFTVTIDGRECELIGHSATVVKLLTVNAGALVVDRVVDVLWPETDLPTGRRRLRNVLGRARRALGRHIVERNGEMIRFVPRVQTDWAEAHELARNALFTEAGSLATADKAAQALVPDDQVLIENLYDDWADEARHVHRGLREQVLAHRAELQTAMNR